MEILIALKHCFQWYILFDSDIDVLSNTDGDEEIREKGDGDESYDSGNLNFGLEDKGVVLYL